MKMKTQTLLANPPIGKISYYLQPTRAELYRITRTGFTNVGRGLEDIKI
jgi:hypothetical protein